LTGTYPYKAAQAVLVTGDADGGLDLTVKTLPPLVFDDPISTGTWMVASNGNHFLVIQGAGDATATAAMRVASDGTILDSTPCPLSTDHGFPVAAASSGGDYLVTWTASTSIRGQRVHDGNGTVLDGANGILIADGVIDAAVAADSLGYAVLAGDKALVRVP